jgi:hypothetical protein
MMIVGVAGMIASAFLFRDATPGNMLGLPASIVLLLALGAFLSGLLPSRSIVGVEPIDRALLDKLNFRVARSDPRVMSLSELDIERAADNLRAGASIEEAARQVYPEYEELDDFAKRALHSAVKDSVRARNRT